MTAVRKVIESNSIADIFDLPPILRNRKVEVIVFPLEDSIRVMPKFDRTQIEKAANSPRVRAIVGVLKDTGLPPDITIKDIRQMRLEEKYKI